MSNQRSFPPSADPYAGLLELLNNATTPIQADSRVAPEIPPTSRDSGSNQSSFAPASGELGAEPLADPDQIEARLRISDSVIPVDSQSRGPRGPYNKNPLIRIAAANEVLRRVSSGAGEHRQQRRRTGIFILHGSSCAENCRA